MSYAPETRKMAAECESQARAGNVLGTAAYLRYDALGWIAMMLVDPAERRAGLGAQLLTEALAAVAGAPCVGLDATPAGEPLYRRFGFVGDYSLVRTKATVDGARCPEERRVG